MSTHLHVKHPRQIKESATHELNDEVVMRHLPVFTLVLPFLVMADLQSLSSYSDLNAQTRKFGQTPSISGAK